MAEITFTREEREILCRKIQMYLREELGQEVGQFDAGFLLDFFAVLRRASLPMPTVVKTLDAIRLTSALMLRERLGAPVTFATHDIQQATAAFALAFQVLGA